MRTNGTFRSLPPSSQSAISSKSQSLARPGGANGGSFFREPSARNFGDPVNVAAPTQISRRVCDVDRFTRFSRLQTPRGPKLDHEITGLAIMAARRPAGQGRRPGETRLTAEYMPGGPVDTSAANLYLKATRGLCVGSVPVIPSLPGSFLAAPLFRVSRKEIATCTCRKQVGWSEFPTRHSGPCSKNANAHPQIQASFRAEPC